MAMGSASRICGTTCSGVTKLMLWQPRSWSSSIIAASSRGVTSSPSPPRARSPSSGRRRSAGCRTRRRWCRTTLTEKFLLYGGAVQLAGRSRRERTSGPPPPTGWSWKGKRGISSARPCCSSSTAAIAVNLLDTPGHKDFSEDTYRVLTAVDAVVMVIDAGKGIEAQTRKLFEVCRQRGVPIFTFMNKLDRPTRDPLALLDELESVWGLSSPINWPMERVLSFAECSTCGGGWCSSRRAGRLSATQSIEASAIRARPPSAKSGLTISTDSDASQRPMRVLAGRLTPVFFGSASNNFGVHATRRFLDHSPPPRPRPGGDRRCRRRVAVYGFVFKIQANMDPSTATASRSWRAVRSVPARHEGAPSAHGA